MIYILFLLSLILFFDLDFVDINKNIIYGILFFIVIFGRIATEIIDSFFELNPIAFLIIVPFVYYFALNN